MSQKTIIMTVLAQQHLRPDWYFDFDGSRFADFLQQLTAEMAGMGISLSRVDNREQSIAVKSYADLLNCVKLSSPQDHHHHQCVGHIIGKSEHLDILEDIGRAVRRLAFAPETIAPDSAFRKVCHNCGCGC